MSLPSKPIHLPWNLDSSYWITLISTSGKFESSLTKALTDAGMKIKKGTQEYAVIKSAPGWEKIWEPLRSAMANHADNLQAAILAVEVEPSEDDIVSRAKPIATIDAIARSLWLGEAVKRGDVVCYMQPVMAAKDKVFGYESFVRVREGDKIIGGEAIVAAAQMLGIEFALDKHLHVEAIKTFVASSASGFLFINMFPGFIQRPDVYLEGLGEAARAHGLIAKYIVLDFTKVENPHDLNHLKKVTDYCRSKGYSIALDDVESTKTASLLLSEIKPDYLRLDRSLAGKCKRITDQDMIKSIVADAHKQGVTVIGEGIEDEEVFTTLKNVGVDLFQGYFFSPPVAMPAGKKAASS